MIGSTRHGLWAGIGALVLALLGTCPPSVQAQAVDAQGINTDVTLDRTFGAPVRGVINGPGENVAFSGQVLIRSRAINDSVLRRRAQLEMTLDFSQVSGRGQKTGKTYPASGVVTLVRPLLAFDEAEVHFPFFADGLLSARSALASFQVFFTAAQGVSVTPIIVKDVKDRD